MSVVLASNTAYGINQQICDNPIPRSRESIYSERKKMTFYYANQGLSSIHSIHRAGIMPIIIESLVLMIRCALLSLCGLVVIVTLLAV